MQKLKTEKGITLIALIITIIVMLILVGVTVTVALNGGLFTTAKEATNKTQLEIDKEQLLELALGAMNDNGKVVIGDLDTAVAADGKFTGTDGTYTSVKSGNVFTVNEWGSVTVAPEEPEYTLSGKWKFISVPTPSEAEEEGIYVSQNIAFTVYDSSAGEENSAPYTFNSITAELTDTNDDGSIGLMIYFDAEGLYDGEADGWYSLGNDDILYDGSEVIDFGTSPQTVSKEFYEWFTANANPVEE